ncbi:MAG: hypothetical protein HY908_01790 [Myxococcales bacterium]|nr:hypothetical protein [Myxococcales bacterium]
MHPALTYGFLALFAALVAFGVWLGGKKAKDKLPRLSRIALVFQLLPFGAAYLVLRPGAGLADTTEVQAALDEGQPVLLDLYSNF